MKALKNVKAISPLVATIILITITIVGGLMVYALFTTTSNTAGAVARVSVVPRLVKTPEMANFTINIKNEGNKPVVGVTYTLNGEETVTASGVSEDTPISPGMQYAESFAPEGEYTVGESYVLVVEVAYSDGSTSSDVYSVMCTSG